MFFSFSSNSLVLIGKGKDRERAPMTDGNNGMSQGRLFTNRRFLSLFLGQGVSYFGDSIASVAIPLLVIFATGSGFMMGFVGMLEQGPLFVVGLPAGVLVDRWNRRWTMISADLGRAALMATIPGAVWLHLPLVPVVSIVAVCGGILSVFFGAAYTGTIPASVPLNLVGRANGYFEAIESAAYLFGPVLAGVLTARIGAAPTLLIDAGSFLVSAIAIGSLKDVDGDKRLDNEAPQSLLRELHDGLSIVLKDSTLTFVVVLWGLNRFLFSALIPVLTFFVTKTLHDGSPMVGVVVGVYAAGSLAGTLAAPWLIEHLGRFGSLAAQVTMAAGALVTAIGWHNATVCLMMGAILLGFGEGILLVDYLTLRSTRPPQAFLGRVYSITSSATQGAGAIGFLVIGGLLSLCGGRVTLMLIFVLALLCVVLPLLLARRRPAEG